MAVIEDSRMDDELQISFQDMDTVVDFIKELGYNVEFCYWGTFDEFLSYDGNKVRIISTYEEETNASPQPPYTIVISDGGSDSGAFFEYSDSDYSTDLSASDLIKRILSGGIEKLNAINQIYKDAKEKGLMIPSSATNHKS